MNGTGTGPYQSEDDYDDGPPPSKIPHYGPGNPGGSTMSAPLPHGAGLLNTNSTPAPERQSTYSNPLPTHGTSTGAQQRAGNICCLLEDGRRCVRPAGNASYNKRVQKTVGYKRLRLDVDNNAQHIYICDHHKMIIQNARSKPRKESEDEVVEADEAPEVDLFQLQVNTLRRYKKHFKIPTRPGLNKAQLADILMRNFKTIPVSEKEVVTYFIYSVKSERNKLDMDKQDRPGADYDLTRY